jgi:calcineurin-like phosphoesterase family protein
MRWFTSDWHFNHQNIIPFANRPFWKTITDPWGALGPVDSDVPDTDAMNKTLIDNFNDLVAVDDEAWFVGDLAMGERKISVPLFKQLKCRNLFLVPGNHDHCHKMFPKWRNHVPLYEDAGFTIMDSQETLTIAGEEVLVCHFPYWGDSHFDDRYSGLRPDDEGQFLIHGHTHSPEKQRGRQLHVGVDAWEFKPASDDDIISLMQNET